MDENRKPMGLECGTFNRNTPDDVITQRLSPSTAVIEFPGCNSNPPVPAKYPSHDLGIPYNIILYHPSSFIIPSHPPTQDADRVSYG
jgi:hypothetical protein